MHIHIYAHRAHRVKRLLPILNRSRVEGGHVCEYAHVSGPEPAVLDYDGHVGDS